MYCTACGAKLEVIDSVEGKRLRCTASEKVYTQELSDNILIAVNNSKEVDGLARDPREGGPWRCINCNRDLEPKKETALFYCKYCNFEIRKSLQFFMQNRVLHIHAKN